MLISVIIPHYNNWNKLELCLNALENQSLNRDKYEIIVVDNGSSLWDVLVEKKFPKVSFLKEQIPGSYVARNFGIRNSSGDLLAFTDSDCIPDKCWLKKGIEVLNNNPGCGLVGGSVQLFSRQEHPTTVERYEMITAFRQDIHINQSHFSVTANMFSFRKIFNDVGLFDEQRFSGGDVEWGNRVFNAGYKLIFATDAIIRHPARESLRSFYITIARKTAARYDRNKSFSKHFRIVPPIRRPLKQILLNDKADGLLLKVKLVFLMYFETYAPNFELLLLVLFNKDPERN